MYNILTVFMQTLNVKYVFQVRIIWKRKWISQAKEKRDWLVLIRPDFWMIWKSHHGISCAHFKFFCVELTVRKDTWIRPNSVTVRIIFSNVSFWKLFDHSYDHSNYEVHWQQHFKRHPTNEYLILSSRLE